MVRALYAKSREAYLSYLARLIAANTAGSGGSALLIDCMNSISQYIFERKDLDIVIRRLYVVRIEVMHDLLDMLSDLHLTDEFSECSLIAVSSFSHLIEGEKDNELIERKVHKMLKRFEERYGKTAVIIGVRRLSDIQYRLNDM